MLNVQIVSRETIKPSSPTLENRRRLQLSFLDQLCPTTRTSIILFYSPEETTNKSNQLKKSLSDVLTCFYPLAGRLMLDDGVDGLDYTHVECNDEGVEFYEARARGDLSEWKSADKTTMLLPPAVESPSVPLLLQFNVFNCGGSAIGVSLSHKLGDGASLAAFIKGWADANRTHKLVSPTFGFATLFPPRTMTKQALLPDINENPAHKRLTFEPSKIKLLKEKVHTVDGFFPTRVEAVTALIWRCTLRARGEKKMEKRPLLSHAVNIRGRMDPPLPEYSFGNLTHATLAIGERVADDRSGDRVGFLEGRLREAIGKMKGDYIREMLEKEGGSIIGGLLLNSFRGSFSHEKWEDIELGFDYMLFTSWFGFPFFESDFGWGKPEFLRIPKIPLKDIVTLLPTRNGGMEAWIALSEEEMVKFEQDPELLAFVSYCI